MPDPSDLNASWILIGLVHGGERLSRIELSPLPFRIGRRPGLELTLPHTSVSREHAEFYLDRGDLRMRDLGSTNGTYVNRKRILDQGVSDGDIIHFGECEFRLTTQEGFTTLGTMEMVELPKPVHLAKGTQELQGLLRQRAVTVLFQPIVGLPGGGVIGYEALGRGCYPGIPASPTELFQIGEALGVQSELSRLFRQKAVETAATRDRLPMLFLNTHPSEVAEPMLLQSLGELRRQLPDQPITVEIHEAAIVKTARIVELRAGLRDHRIGLAYDDFGAGQARLLELSEVPPDFLKFDMRFVQRLDDASESKRHLLKSLVEIASDLGVEPLAEGVETGEEAEACIELGFTHAQGYYYGRPLPIDQL